MRFQLFRARKDTMDVDYVSSKNCRNRKKSLCFSAGWVIEHRLITGLRYSFRVDMRLAHQDLAIEGSI